MYLKCHAFIVKFGMYVKKIDLDLVQYKLIF